MNIPIISKRFINHMTTFFILTSSVRHSVSATFIHAASRTPIRASNKPVLYASSIVDDVRNAFTQAFTTMTDTSTSSPYYTVAITGSTGLIGSALIDELQKDGKTVNGKPAKIIPLIRETIAGKEDTSTLMWNPNPSAEDEPALDPELLRDVDAVIHLAGENVATGLGPLGFLGIRPWTEEKKNSILNSRILPSRAIATAVQKCDTPTTFIGASGVGVYGYDFIGENSPIADEDSDTQSTSGFLAEVSRVWESAENTAQGKKSRVVNLRFGVVMSKLGGALAKLYPIFFLGGGGNVGNGEQFFSFVSARDVARAIVHTLETPSLKGPVNVCAPNPCTNAEFTSAMGKVMGRPTILPLPEFIVKTAFGEMGEEMLLGGNRVYPKKLLGSGFTFQHPNIEDALQSAINEENI